jgi:hypothetical protein
MILFGSVLMLFTQIAIDFKRDRVHGFPGVAKVGGERRGNPRLFAVIRVFRGSYDPDLAGRTNPLNTRTYTKPAALREERDVYSNRVLLCTCGSVEWRLGARSFLILHLSGTYKIDINEALASTEWLCTRSLITRQRGAFSLTPGFSPVIPADDHELVEPFQRFPASPINR